MCLIVTVNNAGNAQFMPLYVFNNSISVLKVGLSDGKKHDQNKQNQVQKL